MIAFLPRDSTNYCIPRPARDTMYQTLRRTSGHAH